MTIKHTFNQPLLIPVIASIVGALWFYIKIIYSPALLCGLWLSILPLALHAYTSEKTLPKKAVSFVLTLLTVALIMQTASVEFDEIYAVKNRTTTLSGTVCSLSTEHKNQKITLKNISLATPQKMAWTSYAYVFCPTDLALQQNDVISLRNIKLKKPTQELALYLQKEHALGFFFAQDKNLIINHDTKVSPSWIDTKKEVLQQLIRSSFSKKTAESIQSIFLGKSSLLSPHTRALFEQWGISHYLARSGLHLVMLVFLMALLLNSLSLPMLVVRILTLVVVILYHALTTPSISFLRALFMNFAFAGAFLIGTQPNTLHIFLATTLITMLLNPFVVFYADFQLSFGITCALILVFNKCNNFPSK